MHHGIEPLEAGRIDATCKRVPLDLGDIRLRRSRFWSNQVCDAMSSALEKSNQCGSDKAGGTSDKNIHGLTSSNQGVWGDI